MYLDYMAKILQSRLKLSGKRQEKVFLLYDEHGREYQLRYLGDFKYHLSISDEIEPGVYNKKLSCDIGELELFKIRNLGDINLLIEEHELVNT
jgi:hypothetical protein